MITPTAMEALERATVAAVAPASEELDGWLLAFDAGTIGRAKSAVPLRRDAPAARIGEIEARYAARGLRPEFRIADDPALDDVRCELARRGYDPRQPTLVKVGAPAGMTAVASDGPGDLADRPDEAWRAVFLGQGFDPVDGAHRIRALGRGSDVVYGQVREDGRTLAVGVATFGFGWAGVHGMRTAQAHRGRGLAGRVLAGLGAAARERGIERIFLQVEEANAPARALYRRAGFKSAWRYHYWRKA